MCTYNSEFLKDRFLGPLLFVVFIYVYDIMESITCNCIAYADDLKIYADYALLLTKIDRLTASAVSSTIFY